MTCHNYVGHHYQMVLGTHQLGKTLKNKFAVRRPADARSDVHARCHPAGRSRGSFWSPQCYLGTSQKPLPGGAMFQHHGSAIYKPFFIQHGTQEKHIVQVGKFILKIQPFRFHGKFRGCNGGTCSATISFCWGTLYILKNIQQPI